MNTKQNPALRQLESESIEIFREAVAGARNAFYPAPPPLPLLHVDTTWKFREMVAHRDRQEGYF